MRPMGEQGGDAWICSSTRDAGKPLLAYRDIHAQQKYKSGISGIPISPAFIDFVLKMGTCCDF